MEELVKQVNKLVVEEEERSMKHHPLFNSTHEGIAVIKEEIEETEDELSQLNENTLGAWHFVKKDNTKLLLINIEEMEGNAIRLAAEAIQTAAMCNKFIESFKNE